MWKEQEPEIIEEVFWEETTYPQQAHVEKGLASVMSEGVDFYLWVSYHVNILSAFIATFQVEPRTHKGGFYQWSDQKDQFWVGLALG